MRNEAELESVSTERLENSPAGFKYMMQNTEVAVGGFCSIRDPQPNTPKFLLRKHKEAMCSFFSSRCTRFLLSFPWQESAIVQSPAFPRS